MLNLLYRYQGRIDTHVVSCLDHLMRIVANDREVQHYFSQLPSLTYQHARYTDWIGPYLQSLLNQTSSQYNGTSHENIVKVQSNFQVYSDYLKQLDQAGSEDAQMVSAQENPVIRCNPQPIMILRGEDENYCGVIEKDGVLLSVTMVRCSFVESEPTGFTNLSVPAGFWTKYQHPEGSKSAAAMLKDREKQM